ncbi:hypothetical protein F511_05082 [Dorcoceras hygrometricum]|uniref:Uncharacterized protein n=1 Tax=Dorcoceras hygrometricum TaxID=472368 RepID=A0A2Z7DCC3_9LAMI|nr:hypothetical protein F511_05082 [Dorcoceras hygrometricum]
MGNADPNKTKAGNKYEVKPQYEELSKQINMQHAIKQCYECMRLSKEISQLGWCNNQQIISCRLYTTVYQPGNHRSVIIGARQPITARRSTLVSGSHRSDDSVGLFGHDPTVGQSQRGTQSGYQIKSVNQAQDNSKRHGQQQFKPTALEASMAKRNPKILETESVQDFALSSQLTTASKVGIKRKVFQEVSNATKNSKTEVGINGKWR